MCADYQTKGNTNSEIYMESFAQLYYEIKKQDALWGDVMKYVDIKTTIIPIIKNHFDPCLSINLVKYSPNLYER